MPSSVVWVEIELSWGWAGVEIELRLSLASIGTLQLKYLRYSIEVFEVLFHFTTFPVGGRVAGIAVNKAISSLKLKLKLSWVEWRLSLAKDESYISNYKRKFIISLFWDESHHFTYPKRKVMISQITIGKSSYHKSQISRSVWFHMKVGPSPSNVLFCWTNPG